MILNRTTGIAIMSAFIVVGTWTGAATRNGRSPAGDGSQPNAQQDRKEQMRQEAQATHQQIKDLLSQVLGAAAKNERPSDALLQKGRAALEDNKQNALAYDDKQRADYMLLQAWTGYYQDDMLEALNWSMRACKQDEASQDAWISQAVFNMIQGKRPLEPKIEKPKVETDMRRSMSYRPRRNNQVEVQKYDPEPYSVKGVLEFDLPAVRAEMFRERFERMECRTTSGRPLEYVPGRDIFCGLFWQSAVAAEETDPNRPAAGQTRTDVLDSSLLQGYGSSTAADIDSQRQYFLNLMRACKDDKAVKFVQVDTIRPKDLAAVNLGSYDSKGIATVIAAHPDCNAKQLACDAANPFMMIVDKDGAVKYAGPAAGFVPAFILTAVSGRPIKLAGSDMGGSLGALDFGQPRFLQFEPGVDPNALPADPNQPQAGRQTGRMPVTQSEPDFPGQELIDEYDAQKLLQLAQMKIEQSRKLGNPRDGIAAARKVIEKYPDTLEAQQAKELLRRVPDKYKKEYNITEEELL